MFNFVDKLKRIDLSFIKNHLDNFINRLNEACCKIKKFKYTKVIAALLSIVIITSYVIAVYRHNKMFPDTERVICNLNERVEFGKNLLEIWTSEENSKKADGYFITLSNARVMSFDEIEAEFGLDRKTVENNNDGSALPDKLLIIDVLLENESCEDNWEYAIPLYDLVLFGYDWYTFNFSAVTDLINSTKEYPEGVPGGYLTAEPKTQRKLYLAYVWDDSMADKEMWVHLTVSPKQLDVKIEL